MRINETVDINKIIWIRSLPKSEMGPSSRMTDDIGDLVQRDGRQFILCEVSNRQELIELLTLLKVHAENGWRPLIHFDMHGLRDEGLLLAPSTEHFAWLELISALREINIATENNLCCVFAVCHGYQLVMQTELKKATPCYLIMAPIEDISIGFLESETLAFYRAVFENENIGNAFKTTLAKQMNEYHCQVVLAKAIAHYVKEHCQGKEKTKRRERLVTDLLEKINTSNVPAMPITIARKTIRKEMEPGQHIIDRYAPTFLIGRKPQFSYDDITNLNNDVPATVLGDGC